MARVRVGDPALVLELAAHLRTHRGFLVAETAPGRFASGLHPPAVVPFP